MNKKLFNENCRVMLEAKKIDMDMLIQAYANLNAQVGKYAYLKKKYANTGYMNGGNIWEFETAIKKRNVIEDLIKCQFIMETYDIKNSIQDMEIYITKKCCDELVELIKSDDFRVIV